MAGFHPKLLTVYNSLGYGACIAFARLGCSFLHLPRFNVFRHADLELRLAFEPIRKLACWDKNAPADVKSRKRCVRCTQQADEFHAHTAD